MNKGNTAINVRFSEKEILEILADLDYHNSSPVVPQWSKSDYVRHAVKEFIRKRVAGRGRKYVTDLFQEREPGVPPL